MPSARPAACCPNIRVQVKVVSGGSACLSWRKRRLLQARRALVARTGAQLARGAALCTRLPVSRSCGASPCARRVPHSKRHNRIPQRGVTCRTDGRRNGLAMPQLVRPCDQPGVKVT